jgi:hypothetical protein
VSSPLQLPLSGLEITQRGDGAIRLPRRLAGVSGESRPPSALRATRAYITSFGTTGLLIASALLTLAVMSAFVAFNGFPGQDVQDPIGTLLLQERQTPVNVPAKPVHVSVQAARAASAAGSGGRTAARHVRAPKVSTGPVLTERTPAQTPTQSPATAPGSTSSQGTTLVPQETSPITTPSTPQLPDTALPQVPSVTVPPLPPPPGDTQLPVDTSGVTGLLGGG